MHDARTTLAQRSRQGIWGIGRKLPPPLKVADFLGACQHKEASLLYYYTILLLLYYTTITITITSPQCLNPQSRERGLVSDEMPAGQAQILGGSFRL